MYVGNQTEADPNGFLDGQLYVLKVTGHDFETLPEDVPQAATWTPVPREIALDPTGAILSDWVDGEGRSTNFRRLEDIHEDPNHPGNFYFATTGSFEKTGTQLEATLNPQEADNPYGKLYRFALNPDDPTADFTIEAIHTGGPGRGVSFDNLTVDSNSNVIVQEDKTAFGGEVMAAENRDGRILSYDTATDTIAPIPARPHTITDFTPGEDTIAVQGVPNGFASLILTQEEADVALAAGDSVLARLLGVQVATLGEADFR